ncbi:MAG: L,D-transpeptidase [Nitrosomonas sp.]|uniref:L,D-transpeptidase family protein n=1 Tax=Nitrosomonas sp. TaxID=42353 RepID=UPI0025EE3EE7|nr:L,D-transpeptidase [Nitrosomonas sp.]MBY0474127.1 L,D-transpeptidase [Nitrosomonas sp.]
MQNTVRADNGVWIDVDTAEQTLLVMQGDSVKAIFENVAIGRYGTTWSKVTKDDKTPLGRFRVGWVNEKSRYYRFFGLNYPNLDTANRALEENRIDEETWLSIKQAKSRGRTPPQDTSLGGHIGIHGIGRGDQEVHHKYNWTNGCVALTNEQIDQLGKWIKPGIWVNIR